jgi:dihydrolipoamide dehydrogenase
VIVIGAGPESVNVADRTRATGLSAVIAEGDPVGGGCTYRAYEPSNPLLGLASTNRRAQPR